MTSMIRHSKKRSLETKSILRKIKATPGAGGKVVTSPATKKQKSSSSSKERNPILKPRKSDCPLEKSSSLSSGTSSGFDCLLDAVAIELGEVKSPQPAAVVTQVTPVEEADAVVMSPKAENNGVGLKANVVNGNDSEKENEELLNVVSAEQRTPQPETPQVDRLQVTKPVAGSAFGAVTPLNVTKNNTRSQPNLAGGHNAAMQYLMKLRATVLRLEQHLGKEHPEVARIYLLLTRYYTAAGWKQQAEFCLRRSWVAFRANSLKSSKILESVDAYKELYLSLKGNFDPEDPLYQDLLNIERTFKEAIAVRSMGKAHFHPAATPGAVPQPVFACR